jgi:hypothetical protein
MVAQNPKTQNPKPKTRNPKPIMTSRLSLILAALLTLALIACDNGLDPEIDIKPGIDGTVTLEGGWPETSEIREAYVIVFKNVPEDSADAVSQFLAGNIIVSQLTPPFQETYAFSIDLEPATYELTVCVGIKGNQFLNLSTWVLAGIYSETNSIFAPSAIVVPPGERVGDIHLNASVISPLPFTL